MRFKYGDKIIDTPNLEKKLKRMKLTMDDIEILPDVLDKLILEDDDTPVWLLNGFIKHKWINNDPESDQYKWQIIGFHKKDEPIRFPKECKWNKDKCILIPEEKWISSKKLNAKE